MVEPRLTSGVKFMVETGSPNSVAYKCFSAFCLQTNGGFCSIRGYLNLLGAS